MEEEGAETPKLGKEQEEERLEHVGMEEHKRVKRTLENEQPKRKTPLKLLYKEKDCQPTALQHLEESRTHWKQQNLHSRGQQLLQMIVMERKELAEPLISTDAVECAVIALELKQAEEVECRADLRQMKPELVTEKKGGAPGLYICEGSGQNERFPAIEVVTVLQPAREGRADTLEAII